MTTKPSTRLHWVYNTQLKLVVFSGPKTACNRYWVQQEPQARQNLVVEPAPR